MQLDFFFQSYGVVAVVTWAIITSQSAGGHDLRPSDHGLASYQQNSSPPPQDADSSQQTLSFFGSTASSSATLPEAQSTTAGSGGGEDRIRSRGDVRGDLTRMGLLVASGVCGMAGVVLLVVSAVVFFVRRRKHRAELAERLPSDYELHAVNDK